MEGTIFTKEMPSPPTISSWELHQQMCEIYDMPREYKIIIFRKKQEEDAYILTTYGEKQHGKAFE